MARIYESEHPPPHLPRTSVFHYIFPPERKGRPPRYYPQPVPQSVAFIDGVTGRKLMRDEIPVHAMWLNSGLLAMGLKKGDVACIFGTNSLDWVEACFACQALGAIVSPANYGYTDTELLYQLTDSGAKVIFIQPELVPTLEKALAIAPPDYKIDPERIILMCEYDAKPANIPYRCMTELWRKQAVPKQLSGDHEKDTAYLCYSSGTTGKAKGVMTSHHNMTSEIQALNVIYEPLSHEKKDVILGILPFGHIYGLTTLIHQPMTRSVPVVVLPRFEETAVLKAIQDYQITFALVVPPVLIALLHSPNIDNYDLSSLRGFMSGAAPCSADLVAAIEARFPSIKTSSGYGVAPKMIPKVRVTQGYGLTETSPVTHVMTLEEGSTHGGKVGKIMPTVQARLVDVDTGIDVEPGQKGELWLRGPNVMKGYWKNEEATNQTFAPGGWFKTGDVATVDAEGYFAIVDRVKELIKYKGYQVPPAELESLLLTHPDVADSGVIGIYSESEVTELPRAYIVPKGGLSTLSQPQRVDLAKQVAQWVSSRVSNPKRLRGGVVLLDAIPKSPSGKILRKKLKEMTKQEVEEEAVKSTRRAKL